MPRRAERIEITLPGSEARGHKSWVANQTLVNLFPEVNSQTGQLALYGAPGLLSFVTLPTGPIRGVHTFLEDQLIAVGGEVAYVIEEGGSYDAVGTVAGVDPVVMANNGLQAVIVSDLQSYVLEDDLATFSTITDPDFLGASSVDFLDQYMIYSKRDSGVYFFSALADALSYDALDVATAERRPDRLRRVIVLGTEIILCGTKSFDGRYNSGAADLPFEATSLAIDYGLAGRDAIAKLDNTIMFVDDVNTPRALRGGTPEAIGGHEIINTIKGWNDKALIRGFAYRCRGHEFFAMRHPDGCVVIDAAPQQNSPSWHKRESYNSPTWKIGCAENIWGKDIAGDVTTGDLYEISDATYDEDGDHLVRVFETNALSPSGAPFTLHALEIDLEPGVGILSGQGEDPRVWVQLSRDGGNTFGARREKIIGARGARKYRIRFTNFGQFRPHGGVIRFGISDPVSLVIVKMWAEVTVDNY